MVHAYVMAITAAGTSADVLEAVTGLPGVTEAHVVAGDYDLVIEIDRESVADILRLVSSQVGEIDGVGTTRTYVSID